MTETKEEQKKKPLGLARPGKLELKKTVETGQVKQSFSHGRSKMVTVEVRKKRTFERNAGGKMAEVKEDLLSLAEEAPVEAEEEEVAETTAAEIAAAPHLTSEEKAVRVRALEDAKKRQEEDQERAVIEAQKSAEQKKAEAAAAKKEEEENALQAQENEQEKRQADEEARKQADEEERKREEQAKAAAATAAAKLSALEGEEGTASAEKAKAKREAAKVAPPKRPSSRRGEPRRRAGKLTISEALTGSEGQRMRSEAARRRAREKQKQQSLPTEAVKVLREVTVPETITVQELANRMAERAADVIKTLMNMGVMATINQNIDADTAELVIAEFGHMIKRVSDADVEDGLLGSDDDETNLESRAPVVTVMGHVDHGKTSLLDALRETDVAAGEAGGITQHIGAYQVTLSSGAKITFIDTPGHAAFTDMRARGAQVTDIVVLVVAADDGIMPQTIEAIHHAKAAEVPIIIAINKMDRPDADANRVRTELLSHEIVVEEMGGEILTVEVSAKERTNLAKLEETILLQSEILDLKANPDRPAAGVIIEAKIERGRGAVATALVQRGTLKVGDIFVAGGEWGKVRALIDDHGNEVKGAGPSVPVEVLGLNGVPAAGEDIVVVDSEARAREVSEFRTRRQGAQKAAAGARGTLEQMFEKIKEGEAQELPVVIKADVHGSLEALQAALEKLATDEVKVRILHAGVGGINESDVTLARASQALVIGFNVRANPQAREMSRRDSTEIRYYSIIYDAIDDLKQALSGMLAPALRENLLGYAQIREVFSISKVGKIAGCMVTEGQVKRGAKVRLLRDDVVIHEGELSQLKRFKDDAREVKEGTECGMSFANYHDLQVDDMIECFEIEEVAREL